MKSPQGHTYLNIDKKMCFSFQDVNEKKTLSKIEIPITTIREIFLRLYSLQFNKC